MTLSHWPRLWRTASHLHLSQTAYRVLRHVKSRFPNEVRIDRPHVRDVDSGITKAGEFPGLDTFQQASDSTDAKIVEMLLGGQLRLLNQTLPLDVDSPDWRMGNQGEHRLWTITLHYHEWLYSLASIVRRDGNRAAQADSILRSLLGDWLVRCDLSQPGAEALAWNSYAIATRLGWSIQAWHQLGAAYWQTHADLGEQFLGSIWRQARYLYTHLEWDLRANHLLRDAVGLAWAGTFLQGKEPQRWLQKSAQLAAEQMKEQVLSDGGHFERSPMYHLEVMDDWLSLARLTRDPSLQQDLLDTWNRMAEYAAWMQHPDGGSVQFNDGSIRPVGHCLAQEESLGVNADPSQRIGGRHFRDSGVAVWHGDPWSVFFDVGEIGPDCQPGHAHADTLTLDCSFEGQRLFVDPGTHSYDHDEQRRHDRSTAAHNTVCIDGMDSSEVWHIFRVGRRARPVGVSVEFDGTRMSASGAHTGYDHLAGSPRHQRQVTVGNREPLTIVDQIDGRGEHRVEGGWLLAPEWTAHVTSDGWLLESGSTRLHVVVTGPECLSLERVPRSLYPAYGIETETNRLAWSYQGQLPINIQTTVTRTC